MEDENGVEAVAEDQAKNHAALCSSATAIVASQAASSSITIPRLPRILQEQTERPTSTAT